ncbi:MAG: ParB N-terminal domain-containing protein [Bradymonadia bacterium]
MARTVDLREVVARRSRDIAQAAQRRAREPQTTPLDPPTPEPAPEWLRRVARWLPDPVRTTLRAALADESEQRRLNNLIERLGQEKETLRRRAASLDAAQSDLGLAERRLEASRRELKAHQKEALARQAEAERALARARRAADAASVERRVPLDAILWSPEDAPRPIRAVGRLAANIRRFGQLAPITVSAESGVDPFAEGGSFTLITGYRRMAALEQLKATHVVIRVVPEMDPDVGRALYLAENCLVDGLSANAVSHLGDRLADVLEGPEAERWAAIVEQVLADDEAVVEDVYLEDMAQEALHHLAEGASWVAELRPYWADLDDDRAPLEALIEYFARVSARLTS